MSKLQDETQVGSGNPGHSIEGRSSPEHRVSWPVPGNRLALHFAAFWAVSDQNSYWPGTDQAFGTGLPLSQEKSNAPAVI
jgi:hypothetical protein